MAKSWKAQRQEMAERLAFGVAGWMQTKASQGLHEAIGEDSAKFCVVEIINAGARFLAKTSQRPANWRKTRKHRIDVGIVGRSADARDVYGYVEIAWPKPHLTALGTARLKLAQDGVRVLSGKKQALNAAFVLMGAPKSVLHSLFDRRHGAAERELEAQRLFFKSLLPRRVGKCRVARRHDVKEHFPGYAARCPLTAGVPFQHRIVVTLLAKAYAKVGKTPAGTVYVWQFNKRR